MTVNKKGIFDFGDIAQTGYIPCFHLENDVDYLPDMRKNREIKAVLSDIETNHNHSWYKEMLLRSQKYGKKTALFYRGNKISYECMMDEANKLALALYEIGIRACSEVAVCMTNVPELTYLMLAINKIGAKMNSFSSAYNPNYIKEILSDCDPAVIFVADNLMGDIKSIVEESRIERIVIISRARSLPVDPTNCDEYVPELAEFYYTDDLSDRYIDGDKIITYDTFINGAKAKEFIEDKGTLDTEFLVTYTSGSTKIGFPKAIIHTNRSLIVSGRFHDAEVSGNPDLKFVRVIAMIHPDSNTCLITSISDILMQGWCVAFEPEYDIKDILNYLFLNKPNYVTMSGCFWNEAARQYLIEKRFSNQRMGFLLAAVAAGESIGKGEEYFINRFLKKAKAGSSVSIKGFHFPYVSVSIGGGDCEHGGIYYTLWKTLQSKLHYFKLNGRPIGMLPEKYVVVTALRDLGGTWIECNTNQIGIIAANSATTMKRYKNNVEETKNLIITDNNGRDWVSCNVLGYIDEVGAVHVKGRIEEFMEIGSERVYPFFIDDVIDQDERNILSSTTVFKKDGSIVANVILSPLSKESEESVIKRAEDRCNRVLAKEVVEKIKINVFKEITDFPITVSGKRNIRALEESY